MPKIKKAPFRIYAGVLTAFIVVVAFSSIGFLTMAAEVLLDKQVNPPEAWMSAMLSLASAALGFLIGDQVRKRRNEEEQYYEPEEHYDSSTKCEICGKGLTHESYEIQTDESG